MPDTPDRDHNGRLHDVADRARDTAAHAKDAANDAARRTADSLEANPLAVVAGGLALGALAGALIPRSAKEKELLAPLGRQLGERARAAATAAREAGKAELDQLGISKGAAKDQARGLADGLAKALSTAGTAAADAAKAKPAA